MRQRSQVMDHPQLCESSPAITGVRQGSSEFFNTVVAPLTSVLRGVPQLLCWTAEVERAFKTLKACFTTAPVLAHPDPSPPFIIDVDASEVGLGAVLSQRPGFPPKLWLLLQAGSEGV